MRILHYCLGYPPNRSGGLVKYSLDLMEEEQRQGNQIYSLYPGRYSPLKKTHIRYEKKLDTGIIVYELINSLPLPLYGGISNPEEFFKSVSKKIYKDFLKKLRLDIIHVHTLMGIHKEFFVAAKELGIKICYTTHDYFGLAPEPNFFINGKSYDKDNSIANWKLASTNALSVKKLRLFQLKYYYILKKIMKKLKIRKISEEHVTEEIRNSSESIAWINLKEYYEDIFSHINQFHFNSNLTKDIFLFNLGSIVSSFSVIPITNSSIKKRDKTYKMDLHKKIKKVAYIGPDESYKGFFEFLKLKEIFDESEFFEFHTYGYQPKRVISGVSQHGKYNLNNIEDVYENIDILIVPSLWKETYGLV
ncbi:glycosyltransferase, partial [Enterococcus faecium]|nr:glycosyltransferase [Enterococcus faecium]